MSSLTSGLKVRTGVSSNGAPPGRRTAPGSRL